MKDLEAIVHPLVVAEREKVLATLPRDGSRLVVFDIPLLYETGGKDQVYALMQSPARAMSSVLSHASVDLTPVNRSDDHVSCA